MGYTYCILAYVNTTLGSYTHKLQITLQWILNKKFRILSNCNELCVLYSCLCKQHIRAKHTLPIFSNCQWDSWNMYCILCYVYNTWACTYIGFKMLCIVFLIEIFLSFQIFISSDSQCLNRQSILNFFHESKQCFFRPSICKYV